MVAWGTVSQSCKYAQTYWKLKLYTRSELSRKSLNKKPPTSSTSNQKPEPLLIHLQNIHPRARNTNLSKLGREKWHPGKFMKWYAPLQNREAVAREMQCVRKHPGRSSMQPSLSFASPAKASECLLPVILALAGPGPDPWGATKPCQGPWVCPAAQGFSSPAHAATLLHRLFYSKPHSLLHAFALSALFC